MENNRYLTRKQQTINHFLITGKKGRSRVLHLFHIITYTKGRIITKLMGGGGSERSAKKYSRKRKLNEKKNHARQLTLKNIHATA